MVLGVSLKFFSLKSTFYSPDLGLFNDILLFIIRLKLISVDFFILKIYD